MSSGPRSTRAVEVQDLLAVEPIEPQPIGPCQGGKWVGHIGVRDDDHLDEAVFAVREIAHHLIELLQHFRAGRRAIGQDDVSVLQAVHPVPRLKPLGIDPGRRGSRVVVPRRRRMIAVVDHGAGRHMTVAFIGEMVAGIGHRLGSCMPRQGPPCDAGDDEERRAAQPPPDGRLRAAPGCRWRFGPRGGARDDRLRAGLRCRGRCARPTASFRPRELGHP